MQPDSSRRGGWAVGGISRLWLLFCFSHPPCRVSQPPASSGLPCLCPRSACLSEARKMDAVRADPRALALSPALGTLSINIWGVNGACPSIHSGLSCSHREDGHGVHPSASELESALEIWDPVWWTFTQVWLQTGPLQPFPHLWAGQFPSAQRPQAFSRVQSPGNGYSF